MFDSDTLTGLKVRVDSDAWRWNVCECHRHTHTHSDVRKCPCDNTRRWIKCVMGTVTGGGVLPCVLVVKLDLAHNGCVVPVGVDDE